MARVTLENGVWEDARFSHLALLSRETRYSAIARMARLWSECTERGTLHLTRQLILCIFPEKRKYAEWIVEAELGVVQEDGSILLKGTKGRVEWLKRLQAQGMHGAKGAMFGDRGGRGKSKRTDRNPLEGVLEKGLEGVYKIPQRVEIETPLLTPDMENTQELHGHEIPTDREPLASGHAVCMSESEIDQNILNTKVMLRAKNIPVPENGGMAKLYRAGSIYSDFILAAQRYWGIRKKRNIHTSEEGFYLGLVRDETSRRMQKRKRVPTACPG